MSPQWGLDNALARHLNLFPLGVSTRLEPQRAATVVWVGGECEDRGGVHPRPCLGNFSNLQDHKVTGTGRGSFDCVSAL